MPTARKRETVKDFQKLFNNSQVLIFTEYRGLTVADLTNLRRQLREKGVEYHIAKNTLTELAAKRAGMEQMSEMLGGPVAIAFVRDDIPGATKVLNDFVRTSKIMLIRGGLAGKTVLNADQVSDLTKMLTREQYIAQVLGTMQAPVRNFVTVLSGTLRGFMNVMQARIDQLKEQGDTSGAEAETEAPAADSAQPAATMSTEAATTMSTATEATEAAAPSGENEVATTDTESVNTESEAPSTETTTDNEGETTESEAPSAETEAPETETPATETAPE
ncbi:MAG TPA: 50S ribosomal protein L10 [Chloroflexia bacterium]|nr:50S ribosomal protein L10 [Chloroflexia bacterium]